MVNFNLLPWREYARGYERKIYWMVMCASFGVSGLLLVGVYFLLVLQLHQAERVLLEQQETVRQLSALHGAIDQGKSSAEFNPLVYRMLASGEITKQLFYLMADLEGANSCVSVVRHQQEKIIIVGQSVSSENAIDLQSRWKRLGGMMNLKLVRLQKQGENGVRFRFEGFESPAPMVSARGVKSRGD